MFFIDYTEPGGDWEETISLLVCVILALTQVARGLIRFAQILQLKYAKRALDSTADPKDFHHVLFPVPCR